jgi:C-terminal processing protease CtpA/Prc
MVIGTASVRLIDGSVFAVPRIGVWTTGGVNMDREGVKPDVLVESHPDEGLRGGDAQLDRAVEVLETDVVAWKKKRGGDLARPDATKPSGGVSGPVRRPR